MEIVTDEAILRQISLPVTSEDNVEEIVEQLKKANETAWTAGCGLAAIQIGIPKRIAWFKTAVGEMVLINPEIVCTDGDEVAHPEGCLSIPDKQSLVARFERVSFTTETQPGEVVDASGFTSRVVQHEIDHMNGILNVDRVRKIDNIGRNSLCPCGSLKKYKKCCL